MGRILAPISLLLMVVALTTVGDVSLCLVRRSSTFVGRHLVASKHERLIIWAVVAEPALVLLPVLQVSRSRSGGGTTPEAQASGVQEGHVQSLWTSRSL